MGTCKGCQQVVSVIDMVDGYCKKCLTDDILNLSKEKQKRLSQLQQNKNILDTIIITTETSVDLEIDYRMEVISAECIYGINIIKDFFSSIRDVIGGNIKSLEKSLKDAKNKVIDDLKKEAFLLGGDAVIAIKIEHTYNNADIGNIISVFATGTVVKLK